MPPQRLPGGRVEPMQNPFRPSHNQFELRATIMQIRPLS
jgi:hypothetical protein